MMNLICNDRKQTNGCWDWDHKGTFEVTEIALYLDCEGGHGVPNCNLKMGNFYYI